jgi:alpha-tubulin suppressor-like RCC1 family protein
MLDRAATTTDGQAAASAGAALLDDDDPGQAASIARTNAALLAAPQSLSGAHACAVVNGGAWCWGWNGDGQLGDNSTTDRYLPVAVQGVASGVQAISAGSAHSCALTSTGANIPSLPTATAV